MSSPDSIIKTKKNKKNVILYFTILKIRLKRSQATQVVLHTKFSYYFKFKKIGK